MKINRAHSREPGAGEGFEVQNLVARGVERGPGAVNGFCSKNFWRGRGGLGGGGGVTGSVKVAGGRK